MKDSYFRCAIHGLIPGGDYQKHCDEEHGGMHICVQIRTNRKYVLVRADDLRLLLQKAEPLLVSYATRHDPVVNSIDRLGDALLKASYDQQTD